MTFYESEINRIKKERYKNQGQLNTVILTKKYIDQHFENDLNLDLLSYIRFTSKYHLLRLFKKYYGLTPRQYLINKRVEKAKAFLRAGISATDACFAVGFESPGSFTTLFKRKTGYTPSDFQKEQFSRSTSHFHF